jgi:serine/threonine protein kinase, bacterial
VSRPSTSRVGSRFGPYLLRRLLGRGGFGEVYEAEDTAMHRVVALKLLSSNYSHDPAFRERLFREARTAGRLHSPHVVPIHGCGEIDGQLYIDMRMIDGTDLQGVLDGGGPLIPSRAVNIVRQIGAALDAAHAERVIHRDVKPANILLGADDFACLVDFGLANAATDTKLTSEGTTIGSFAYLAPERLIAGDVTPGADVYALACVLFECLTGFAPYRRDEIPALIAAHLTSPVPRPSEQGPGVPVAFDDVIARGMAKDPDERFRTAGELAAAAQRALSNAPPGQFTPPPRNAPVTAPWQQPRAPALPTQAPSAQFHLPHGLDSHPFQPPRPKPRRRAAITVAIVVFAVGLVGAVVIAVVHTRAAARHAAAPANAGTQPAGNLPPLKATPLPVVGSGELGGVAVDKDGTVYVTDTTSQRVLKLPAGAAASSVLPFPSLHTPRRVAVDAAGDVFVVDRTSGGDRVLKLAAGAPDPTPLPFGTTVAEGIAADAAGNVYLATQDGVFELPVGATAPIVLPFGNGSYEGVAVDGAGTVYVAETGRVRKLTAGSAKPDQLPFPQLGRAYGVAADGRGDVYVIDNGNLQGRLVKLAAGAATSTQLFAPELQGFGGLAVDAAGNVYLTENDRLLKVAAP